MKKLFAIAMVLVIIITLASCGNEEVKKESVTTNATKTAGQIITEEILHEDIIIEDWHSENVLYWN